MECPISHPQPTIYIHTYAGICFYEMEIPAAIALFIPVRELANRPAQQGDVHPPN